MTHFFLGKGSKKNHGFGQKKIKSLQANISNMPFNQKSPGHPEVFFFNCHRPRDKQTDGHRDSMTESAQCANSVKMVFIRIILKIIITAGLS